MDSRALAAFLSSLISELLLLLLLLLPSSNPLTLTSTSSNSLETIFPLIHQFLSTAEIATSLSLLGTRKRKRTHQPDSSSPTSSKPDPGPTQNPDFFKQCFKMSSSTFEWLAGLLEPLLDCRDPVDSPLNLSAETRLGIGLFRLAAGADFPEISSRFGVSDNVAKFCVKQFCRVLCTNFRFWVGFPSQNELESVSTAFEDLTGLPNCCGVIECTRFMLVREEGESIAAQIVVDSSLRILSIVAGFRGDKSDWRVLKGSTLYKDVEGGSLLSLSPDCEIGEVGVSQYVVGGGGYPLLPWLMVPFVDPTPGSSEENFNAVHGLMRLSALRTVASLKSWGVLSRPVEGEFKTVVAYIGACSILHNVLLMRDDDSGSFDGLGDYLLHDQDSKCDRGTSVQENSIEGKASIMRSALATRARRIRDSRCPMNPSSSVQLQSN